MKKIHVTASTEYDISIGSGVLDELGRELKGLTKAKTVVLVSDSNVFPLYGERCLKNLKESGFDAKSFVFKAGEASKCMKTYEELLEFLCESRLTRSDALVALGGGVTGDMTGFAAATYQRGIAYVQVPTTLLAAVDSSVGGKTAIDLKAGKNQVGCFYQPVAVLCDTDTLDTLPESEFRCGMAEVIKYGMLGNARFFSELLEKDAKAMIGHIIEVCVTMKRDIVQRDEFDKGERMLLNFGHTFGHAAEKCSGFSMLHGEGVAMGMATITKAACKLGFCDETTVEFMDKILDKYGLPKTIPYGVDELLDAALADKKIAGSEINLIVPVKVGRCEIEKVPSTALSDWLKAGGVK